VKERKRALAGGIKDSHPTEEVERIKTNPKTNKNESKNESQNEKTNPLRMKNEERRMKNSKRE
jgi:hypothetical protein